MGVKTPSFVIPRCARLDTQDGDLRKLGEHIPSIKGYLAGAIILPAEFGSLTPKSA
jgi:hypothetical protein